MALHPSILVAEDEETEVLLLRRAFLLAGLDHAPRFFSDGYELMEVLTYAIAAEAPLPGLIVLDFKMPRLNGLETLQAIRAWRALQSIPVAIFSSSAHPGDVSDAYASGADAYLVKPASSIERVKIAQFFKEWLTSARLPDTSAEFIRPAVSSRR